MIPMTIEEQRDWLDEHKHPAERLELLMESECVRLVLDGKFSPQELDSAFRNLRKRVRDLERQRTEQAVEIGNLLQRIQYETRCEE